MTTLTQPTANIVGEKIALGPRYAEFVPLFHKWINDFEVTRTYGMNFKTRTLEELVDGYAKENKGAPDYVDFVIFEKSNLTPIGWTSLIAIDRFARTAKFIITIGDKACWGKGFGTEATRLMLDYGFNCLGLHNIWLTVFAFNERGIRAYQKAGFKEFGRWRESNRLGGVAYDTIYMDCLATEFEGSVLDELVTVI